MAGELGDGAAFIERALALNPNLASAWYLGGWVKLWLGEPELAIKHFTHSMRLSPLDPFLYVAQNGIAWAHFYTGRYDQASSWAGEALRENPNYPLALRVFAASSALAGRLNEAHKAIARLRTIDPGLRVSNLGDSAVVGQREEYARFAEGLRKAGLPE